MKITCYSYRGYEFGIKEHKGGATTKLFKDGKRLFTKLAYSGSADSELTSTTDYIDWRIGRQGGDINSFSSATPLVGEKRSKLLKLMKWEAR